MVRDALEGQIGLAVAAEVADADDPPGAIGKWIWRLRERAESQRIHLREVDIRERLNRAGVVKLVEGILFGQIAGR